VGILLPLIVTLTTSDRELLGITLLPILPCQNYMSPHGHFILQVTEIFWIIVSRVHSSDRWPGDLKGGPEPLEKESHEFLGSKRDDQFSNPFFDDDDDCFYYFQK